MEKKRTNKNVKARGNGEGTIYFSEALNKYVAQYVEPSTGKRKTLTQRKNEGKKEFKDRFTKVMNDINQGTYIAKSNDTLLSIIKHHIDQKFDDGILLDASYKRNLETLEQLKKCCSNFIEKPIQKIVVEDIEKSKKEMRETYSQSCIDKMWGLLNKAFKLAYSRRKIVFNIMEDELLTKPFSKKEKKKVEALTIQEEEKLNSILNGPESNHEYTDIAKFQLITGMRIGEVLARSKNNIDLKNNTILVNNTLTKDLKDKTILGEHTKTYNKKTGIDSGIRTLTISNELRKIIQKQFDKKITNIYNLIFWDYKKNTFISNGEINSWLDRLNKKYRITDKSLSTHVLRHTRITRWKEAGVDMKVIQYWAGHVEGSNITDDVYVSLTDEFIKKELAKIN